MAKRSTPLVWRVLDAGLPPKWWFVVVPAAAAIFAAMWCFVWWNGLLRNREGIDRRAEFVLPMACYTGEGMFVWFDRDRVPVSHTFLGGFEKVVSLAATPRATAGGLDVLVSGRALGQDGVYHVQLDERGDELARERILDELARGVAINDHWVVMAFDSEVRFMSRDDFKVAHSVVGPYEQWILLGPRSREMGLIERGPDTGLAAVDLTAFAAATDDDSRARSIEALWTDRENTWHLGFPGSVRELYEGADIVGPFQYHNWSVAVVVEMKGPISWIALRDGRDYRLPRIPQNWQSILVPLAPSSQD